MSLEGIVDEFATGTYTITRVAAGAYNTDGIYVVGATTTLTGITMCVQDVTGRDVKSLPEGQRAEDTRIIFADVALYARIPGREGDVITIGGEPFIVFRLESWTMDGFTHRRAWAARNMLTGGP